MRIIAWTNIVSVFLVGTWSMTQGTNETPAANSAKKSKFYVNKTKVFNSGVSGNLTCGGKRWDETLFIIWNITTKTRRCLIQSSNDGPVKNSCNDGKVLRNTSDALPYLHIPHFSAGDVGIYHCESVYNGGSEKYDIRVSIMAAPTVSAWLDRSSGGSVAVCKAERGNPAANITWSHAGFSESVKTINETDGLYTTESYLEIPEGKFPENLTCFVQHELWGESKRLVPVETRAQSTRKVLWPLAGVGIGGVLLVWLASFLYFGLKKLNTSIFCQQNETSKPPGTGDVEEVEPYASYVQRVNSIYN